MTWTFHAQGNIGEDGHLHERELVKKLHDLFSDPRYGQTDSNFTGSHVQAEVQGDGDPKVVEAQSDEGWQRPGLPTPQEPQRMDPPELQQPGPAASLNPQKNPLMPIDTGAMAPSLTGGPSSAAEREAHAKALAGDVESDDREGADGDKSHDDPSQVHQDRQTDAQMVQDQRESNTQVGTPSGINRGGASGTVLGTGYNK
jgi:hypothetical protein